ncbi:MAG: magnesium chelatase, partial [Lachnospiraceae bacterium]|nr:magnesium chelatase [Lachnospiraceae bacterium]
MFSKAFGAAIHGIDALLVQIEADVSDGLPGFELVGFLASEVREAKERVRVAIHNAGIALPPKRITVN